MQRTKTRPIFFAAAFLIGLFAVFLRCYAPQADIPFDLSNNQAENMDWPWYLYKAFLNLGLIPNVDSNLLPYNQLFYSWYAEIFFRIFGVGPAQLNLLSLLPGILIVAMLAALLRRTCHNPWAVLAGLWIASTNFFLVMYSRLPGIYLWILVGEIFCIGLWTFPWKTPRGRIAVRAASIAATFFFALFVKFMAVVFLGCLVLAWLITEPPIKIKHLTSAFLVLTGLVLAAFFVPAIRAVFQEFAVKADTYKIQTSTWPALSYHLNLFVREQSWTFLRTMPLLMIFAGCSCILVSIIFFRHHKALKIVDVYFALVFLGGEIFSIFLRYRPLRYFIVIVPAAIFLSVRLPFLLGETSSWCKRLDRRAAAALGIASLCLISLSALGLYAQWTQDLTYTWREGREDAAEIIPDQAVVLGAYAHFLTFGLPVAKIYKFADAQMPTPSHICIDEEVNGVRSRNAVDFSQFLILENIYLRGNEIHIYRVPDSKVPLSLFEQGIVAVHQQRFDEARALWQESMQKFPKSGAAARALLQLAYQSQAPQEEITRLREEALRRNPDHPFPWLIAVWEAKQRNDPQAAIESGLHVAKLARYSATYKDQTVKFLTR